MIPGLSFVTLATLLFHPSYSTCLQATIQDGPVVTVVTKPVNHGEGPHWDQTNNVLYYVDISGRSLHRFDPITNNDIHLSFEKPVSLVVPFKDDKYKFVMSLGLELVLLTWYWDNGAFFYSPIISVDQDEPGNRFNDGKADALGRIWAGTIGREEPVGNVQENKATLYRLNNDPTQKCNGDVELRPVTISNGLAWSLDNKVLYYIDTPTRRVDAFDYDLTTGSIANRRTVFTFGDVKGNPDGMTIDAHGNLWIACWGGSQVINVDPKTGTLLRSIQFPVSRVSSVAWGGARLDTLYVTTIKHGLTDEQLLQEPNAGAVFAVTNLQVPGTLQYKAVHNCRCT